MRRCWKCKQERAYEEFPFRNKAASTRQNTCKPCVRENSKKWFRENRERAYQTSGPANRRWKVKKEKELHSIIANLKQKPCLDCSQAFSHWVMQFDHRDPTTKTDNVATMVHNLKPLALILEEISKCDLVCANCHADRTYRRRNKT